MATATDAIREKLRIARVLASDETTTRTNGVTRWQWVFISDQAVLDEIAPRRARSVAETMLGNHHPDVWISDRYGGQQELPGLPGARPARRPVCHRLWRYDLCAHDPRPSAMVDRSRPATTSEGHHPCQLCQGRPEAVAADARARRPSCGEGADEQIKAWRTKFFVFLTDREVPATNNVSKCEIRPSVVFRKVIGGFRSDWGAGIHAGYRSGTGTARLQSQSALGAICQLVDGSFAFA